MTLEKATKRAKEFAHRSHHRFAVVYVCNGTYQAGSAQDESVLRSQFPNHAQVIDMAGSAL